MICQLLHLLMRAASRHSHLIFVWTRMILLFRCLETTVFTGSNWSSGPTYIYIISYRDKGPTQWFWALKMLKLVKCCMSNIGTDRRKRLQIQQICTSLTSLNRYTQVFCPPCQFYCRPNSVGHCLCWLFRICEFHPCFQMYFLGNRDIIEW